MNKVEGKNLHDFLLRQTQLSSDLSPSSFDGGDGVGKSSVLWKGQGRGGIEVSGLILPRWETRTNHVEQNAIGLEFGNGHFLE